MSALPDPRQARSFRFLTPQYDAATGTAHLPYAFDDGPPLVERIVFPDAPRLPEERLPAFTHALHMLHWIAGVSYYKAGVPPRIEIESTLPSQEHAAWLETVYTQGLAEFYYRNQLPVGRAIYFPHGTAPSPQAPLFELPRRALVPIGGGKDSLVSVALLQQAREPATATWVGGSPLIARCAERTGLPTLPIRREIAPLLFTLNRQGAYNGHVPVTAINSAVLVLAALLYGFDAIVFSNERSASSPNLQVGEQGVNHQWSKGYFFERHFAQWVQRSVCAQLNYFSLLRPLTELGVAARFARYTEYHDVFSSCNRNFKILSPHPESRWCGQCPKCHFVFLALAPFLPKPQLVAIFGSNYLDDAALIPPFEALMAWHQHKPFECVGEAAESRAAMSCLAQRPEWQEDAVLQHFTRRIAPSLAPAERQIEPFLALDSAHRVPAHLYEVLHASGNVAG